MTKMGKYYSVLFMKTIRECVLRKHNGEIDLVKFSIMFQR